MKNYKTIITTICLVTAFFASLFISKTAMATNCREVTNEYNSSLRYACDHQLPEGRRGALWVTGTNNSTEAKIIIKNNSEAETVYICGAALANNGRTDNMNATYVRFLTQSIPESWGATYGDTNGIYDDYGFKYLTYNGIELERPTTPFAYATQFNTIKVGCAEAKFNVTGFINDEKYKKDANTDGNGNTVYSLELHAFRCPKNNASSPGACYSDESNLQIIVPPDFFKPEFRSISHVRADDEYENTGIVTEDKRADTDSVYVKKGDMIDLVFSHNIYTYGSKQNNVNWEISSNFNRQGGGTGYSFDSKNLGPENGQGTSNINKQAIWQSKLYEPETLPYTDGSYKYLARDAYKATFTELGNYEFCETISVTNFDNAPKTTACTTIIVTEDGLPPITPNPPDPGEETSADDICKELPESYENTAESGQSNARKIPNINSFKSAVSYYGYSSEFARNSYKDYIEYCNSLNRQDCYYYKNDDENKERRFWFTWVRRMLNYVNEDGYFDEGSFRSYCISNGACNNSDRNFHFHYEYYIDNDNNKQFKFENLDFYEAGDFKKDRTYVKSAVKNPKGGYENWTLSNGYNINNDGSEFYDGKFADGTKPVYAKPGDTINWVHCYYPNIQKLVNNVDTITGEHGAEGSNVETSSNTNYRLDKYYEKYEHAEWQNRFMITSINLLPKENYQRRFPQENDYAPGDFKVRGWKNDYEVNNQIVNKGGKNSRTGMSLFEKITTGSPTGVSINVEHHTWLYADTCYDSSGDSYTCWKVVHHSNEERYAEAIFEEKDRNPVSDQAMVQVPYNFTNTTRIKLQGNLPDDWGIIDKEEKAKDDNNVVYAGDTVTIKELEVKVGPKDNGLVEWDDVWTNVKEEDKKIGYATKVDNAEVRMYAFTSKSKVDQTDNRDIKGYKNDEELCNSFNDGVPDYNCSKINDAKDYEDTEDLVLNSKELLTGMTFTNTSQKGYFDGETFNIFNLSSPDYKVFDAPAGEYFCVAIAVYPAETIGVDLKGSNGKAPWTNTDNRNYSWNISTHCLKIAKKPSFEVWGGNMYSAGKVETYISGKSVIKGVYDYPKYNPEDNGTSSNNKVTFGSWTELGIIANGAITELASGASLGKWNNNSEYYTDYSPNYSSNDNPGGSQGGSFCNRIPLTIPNENCVSNSSRGKVEGSTPPTDKNSILRRFFNLNDAKEHIDTVNCPAGVDECRYDTTEITKSLVVNVSTWYSDGSISIKNNITTDKNARFSSFQQIPKMIIYAKGDINIDCDVNQIDAILIADGTVDTCYQATVKIKDQNPSPAMYNDGDRMNPLKINGTVIADKIILGRTYGSATGKESGTPAEIINYDTSLYLWGRNQSSSITSGKFNALTTYELAPRY